MLPVLLVLLGWLRVHILLLLLTSLFLGLLALLLLEVLLLVSLSCVLQSLRPSFGNLLEHRFLLLLGLLPVLLGDDIVLAEVIFILGCCGKLFFLGLSHLSCKAIIHVIESFMITGVLVFDELFLDLILDLDSLELVLSNFARYIRDDSSDYDLEADDGMLNEDGEKNNVCSVPEGGVLFMQVLD